MVRKSRLLGFPDGSEFKLDFAEFAQRYGKETIEKPSQAIVLATPGEVAEVNRLLDIVKVSDEDQEKWFKKANVEAWNEMTGTQIGGVIGWLQKRMK